jgi:hypothetical protein
VTPHVSVGRLIVLLAVTAIALSGCGIGGMLGSSGGRYPGACADLRFSDRQCAAMVRRAEEKAGIRAEDVVGVDILPPKSDGNQRLSGGMISRVRFHLGSGEIWTEELWCIGVGWDSDRVCREDAHIPLWIGVDHDIPCSGEAPEGCATLPPTPGAAVRALARPLHVPSIDIPIDHLGRYEIEVGAAGLPDGVLSQRSATLPDPRPTAFWIDEGVRLEVRPVDPSRPPVGSVYREPIDGVEPVTVYLVFDVTEFTPGAVLQVRDVVVE